MQDASRIAEILVFTKRMNYRRIFQNDQVSFGEIQVFPLAKNYMDHPEELEQIWVYDDGFVKGMLHMEGTHIAELYVDSFFAGQGIGSRLMEFAIQEKKADSLWVLKKNDGAQRFYQRHGFAFSGEEKLEDGTDEMLLRFTRMKKS